MSRSRLGPILIALVLFVGTILGIGSVSEWTLKTFFYKPGVIQAMAASQNESVFQGTLLQKAVLNSPDILPLYGSSELSARSEFHPSELFYEEPTGWLPFLIGRGGSQDLVHTLSLAAQGDNLKGKKLTIILSAQWFTPTGIDQGYLAQNFSPLQTYKILYSSSLKPEYKREIATRLQQFPGLLDDYPILQRNLTYTQEVESKQMPKKLAYWMLGRMELSALELKDAVKTVRFIRQLSPAAVQKSAELDAQRTSQNTIQNTSPASATNSLSKAKSPEEWNTLRKAAENKGKSLTSNNQLGILDSYYLQYVKPNLANSAGTERGAKLYPSPEYQDLDLLMKILKEYQVEALFVIVPVNGLWYDYLSFPTQERNAYYQRAEKMIQAYGFQVANFGNHEYEKYFLQDVMHIGWKGWVYVDEAMDRFYHQGR